MIFLISASQIARIPSVRYQHLAAVFLIYWKPQKKQRTQVSLHTSVSQALTLNNNAGFYEN
jgi:hypothetical protein